MTGLGAGFASISLRDFSKSSKVNPYPPTNYWMALASIVNTPAGETSNTQYVVLRAMIESHEKRFLQFYGNAALAALCLALVEFPKKAPANASAAGSLRALADLLREDGLALA
jgi:nucleoporin GLE1